MRSLAPKVLHDLCGIPMVLWPVRAALRGGRGQGRRRRLARARARAPCSPSGVAAGRPAARRRHRRGVPVRASRCSTRRAAARREPIVILSGDVPLVARRGDRRADRGARARAAWRRRWRRRCSRTRAATAASCATPTAAWSAWWRPSARATPTQAEREIREVNTGHLRLRVRARSHGRCRGWAPTTRRASCTCPQVLELLRDRRQHRRRAHAAATRGSCSASTTARASRGCARSPSGRSSSATCSPASAIVDPRATVDRRRRRDRRRHGDRAVHHDQGRQPRRQRLHDPPLLPRRQRARGRRERRPVRLPAAGHGAARAARRSARSSRSRTPTSARARKCRTSPTSATPTSARARTSGRPRSPPTTTGARSTARRSGERVRTGVDTTLVAPVTVGDDAYTGAGSVITEDVPPRGARASPARARATSRATPTACTSRTRSARRAGPADGERCRPDVYTSR